MGGWHLKQIIIRYILLDSIDAVFSMGATDTLMHLSRREAHTFLDIQMQICLFIFYIFSTQLKRFSFDDEQIDEQNPSFSPLFLDAGGKTLATLMANP